MTRPALLDPHDNEHSGPGRGQRPKTTTPPTQPTGHRIASYSLRKLGRPCPWCRGQTSWTRNDDTGATLIPRTCSGCGTTNHAFDTAVETHQLTGPWHPTTVLTLLPAVHRADSDNNQH